jgi:hypothetical protein
MIDLFKTHSRSLTSPPEHAAEITPDDDAALAYATRAIFVGGEDNLRLRMIGGGEVTLAGVSAGALLPLRASHVLATGTTASARVGFW